MTTTTGERLLEARKEAGISQEVLAKKSGLSQTTISDIERGRNKGSTEIPAISAELKVEPLWLAEGKGPKRRTDHPPVPVEPGDDFVPVERVNIKISAGISGFRVEHIDGNGPPVFFRRDWIDSKHYRADRLIAVRVEGSSMEPGLYPGDLIVINMEDTTPKDGAVIAANYEGEFIIKRLRRDAGEWFLTSDNPDKRRFGDKKCDEHAEIIGRVVYKQSEHV